MGVSRRKGNVPNIVNTPTGPREREERPKQPRDVRVRPEPPRGYDTPFRERREEKERQEISGDSFKRRRDRRMAGDRTGFFNSGLPMPTGRPTRGDRLGGFPTRGPAPDTRDRAPNEKTRKIFEPMSDRGFGMTINMRPDATPEQRKAAFDKLVAERGPMRPFPRRRRNQDQNIARTDV